MAYASLGDLKSAIRILDTDSDTLLQVALDAAKTAIDEHCNRTFTASLVASARAYTPQKGRIVTDDFYTADGFLLTIGGENIPANTPEVVGYKLEPANAPAKGEPYTEIAYTSAVPENEATVTAKWGFALAIPDSVRLANLLQASRWFARRNSPYGIAGSPEMGSELRLLAKLDADVAVMLSGKVRY